MLPCRLQTSSRLPDFKHRIGNESLWMGYWNNPSWGQNMVEETESVSQSMRKAQAQELRQDSGWEVLSLEEALASLERMPQPPSVENFIPILHKCRKRKNLAHAMRLHAYMRKLGLETHRSLGNYLVPIFVEVGSMCHAQQVFDRLVDRNEYSWTSIITGYTESGEPQLALALYQKMQEDSVNPSRYTFVALLKACAKLNDVKRGREIHAEIARKGMENGLFVGSTLVYMYAQCGLLPKAQEVFDMLPVRDAISWNALITGYANHGLGEEALNCFEQMQLEGLSPDPVTFVCSLKACGSIGAIDMGQQIHAEIATKGLLERDIIVGSALVDMYAKCGLPARAREAFDKLPARNVVSWTALIAGYAEYGLGQEALMCFEQMKLEDVLPNAVTFVFSLKACGSIGAIIKGQEIHTEISRRGLSERHLVVGNALVDMYAKCGLFAKAQEVFDKLSVQDEVSWNALITGYANHGLGEEALNCFQQMQLKGVFPDAVTFVCSLKACGSIGAIDKGEEIHAEIARRKMDKNLVVGSSLVDMYAKCGSLAKAHEVFDKLRFRNEVSWNALIAGYAGQARGEEALSCFEQMQLEGICPNAVTFICSLKACGSIGGIDKGREIHDEVAQSGLLERDILVGNALVDMYSKCGLLANAREVFDKLPVRNEASWNALIAGYANHALGEEALNCFEQMQLEGLSPDAVTFLCSLKACGGIGAIDKGQEIHAEISQKGLLQRYPFMGNTLVDMYAKCGSIAKAHEVFDKLPLQNEVSWNTLIAGFAHIGESENVFHMLDTMIREGIKPDGLTFLSVLTVCSHTGLVDKGQMYFEAMTKYYGITPTIEHHTCMVDLLGRAGLLDEAVGVMMNMPVDPNLVVWRTMLGACRKRGNVELGKQVFEHAMLLDGKDTAAYVLMSNIYAYAHMQEGESKV